MDTALSTLSLAGLSKHYGALQVINKVSFDVATGEAVGILGPNGAGKTTLLKMIAGTVPCSAGIIRFDGQVITTKPQEARCHLGICRTSQIPQPFGGMSVWENVLTAARHGGRKDARNAEEATYASLKRTGLLHRHAMLAEELPLMGRKRLELSRVLACEPKILLLDEIAGGLSDFEVKDLVELIRQIHRSGVTIIWIEHIVHALLSSVGRIIALNFGNLIADGAPSEVVNSSTFRQAYFGDSLAGVGMK